MARWRPIAPTLQGQTWTWRKLQEVIGHVRSGADLVRAHGSDDEFDRRATVLVENLRQVHELATAYGIPWSTNAA